jgi:hypothetical protein
VEDKIKILAKIRKSFLLFKGGVGILLLLFFLFLSFIFFLENHSFEASALSVNPSVFVVAVSPPTGLSGTATSPYQIDLSWNSTSGAVSFNIYRDNAVIATTTSLFYFDNGLAPATAYTYNISAMDNSGMESAKSSSLSITTLSLPSEVEQEQTGGSLFIPPPPENPAVIINNNFIYVNSLSVSLNLFAKNAYQMAISNNSDFIGDVWEDYKIQRNWTLSEGDGEKKVFVKYRSLAGGVSQVVLDSIILDMTPPLNVSNLEAKALDNKIDLDWQNPADQDFKEVWVLRSETFYPSYSFEGVLVYKGQDNHFSDQGVRNGIRYYYTVFSSDRAGNFSSGAVISKVPNFSLAPGIPPEITPEVPPPAPPEKVPSEVKELTLNDFDFIQEGKKIPVEEDKIKVEPEKPLTISIDYGKFREYLKTIMVTLKKDEKNFSFILRIDGDKKKYFAVILPPEPRVYPFDIFIVNYQNQSLKKIPGEMIVRKKSKIFSPELSWEKISQTEIKFPVLWLIILIILLTYIIRRRMKKKREENRKKQEMQKIKNNSFDGLDNYLRKE